jgi:Tfp pilus assembly protein FimT
MRMLRDTSGFTFIEVLTAAGLVGVISALAATNFRAAIPSYRVRGAALQVAGDMNQARLSAVQQGRRFYFASVAGTTYEIRFEDDLGVITVLKNVDVAADFPGVQFGATGIASDPYGNDITAAVPAAAVIFNSDGTITNAASVFIEPVDEASEHGGQHGVVVTPAGRIRVWHYDAGTWS